MTETIVVSLISLAGTLVGSLLGVIATARLTTYRLEQLEKKVDKHNNVVERVYILEKHEEVVEEKIKTANHRIDDLEEYHK